MPSLFGDLFEPMPATPSPLPAEPGTGLQQWANLTRQLSSPSTMTPLEALIFRLVMAPAHNIFKGEIMRDKKKSKTTGKSQNTGAKNCK